MQLEDITLNISPIFNTVEDLKEYLIEHELENTAFFEHPSYVKAITGITSGGHLIYDYDLMILAAMEEEGWDYEDAIDWIDYNVVPTGGITAAMEEDGSDYEDAIGMIKSNVVSTGEIMHPIVSHSIIW